jgi:AcrR family transcriptional regulator
MAGPSECDEAPRRGRPRATSARELQLIALRLFVAQGFENTTIEQIAAEAGVSERTFFRYFGSKASVLFTEFETEVEVIRAALAAAPAGVPMMDAIRGGRRLGQPLPRRRRSRDAHADEPVRDRAGAGR